jgi:DHA1 family inner membrane transport protein
MPLRLPVLLSAGNFVIGLGAFVVIGLVSPIAVAFGATVDQAGRVMTWYALAYAVGSPLVAALTGRTNRRLVLAGGLALFGAGSMLGALAPSLLWLELSRVMVAVGAGLYTPGAAAVTVAIAPPARRATELSVVFAGMTLAQVLGVPLGTWAGYAYGYKAVFLVVAALSGLAAAVVFWATPARLAFHPTSLSALASTVASPRHGLAVLFTATLMAAVYVVYTYLGPMIEERHGFGRDGVTVYLLLFGVAAVCGNFVGGFAADAIGASRTLAILTLAQIVLLPVIAAVPLGPAALGVAVTAWSLAGWSFMTPQQARLVEIGSDRVPIMLALNASCIYLGVAVGSATGGLALAHGGWPMVAVAAALMGLAALVHLVLSDRLAATGGEAERPQDA